MLLEFARFLTFLSLPFAVIIPVWYGQKWSTFKKLAVAGAILLWFVSIPLLIAASIAAFVTFIFYLRRRCFRWIERKLSKWFDD